MPIQRSNPNIPLSALGQPSQQLDVAGTIYRAQAAHAMQAEAQRKQAEAQKQQQIDALASQYEDPEDYIQAVSRIDPLAARKFGEQFEKHKNEKLEGVKREYEAYGKKLDYYMRTLPDDPDDYALWRQAIVARSPDYEPMLPTADRWAADPAVRQQVRMMGMTAAEHVKHKQDVIDKFLKGDYRKGLLEAVATAPTLDVARGLLEEARGFAPKADLNYVNGILATAPDFETARQRAADASGTRAYQQVVIDENGRRVIGAFDPKTADVLSTGVPAGESPTGEPLESVIGPNGKPVLMPRSQAAGMTPMPTGAAADTGPHPGDPALVSSILKFPGLFQGLSDKTKERILPALTAAGFAPTGGEQADLDKVGLMVIDNPDLLKEFPAKDRSKILTHIATAGGEFPNKRKAKVAQMASSALATIRQMKNHPGFKGAVGAKGPTSLFGYMETPMAGTDAADFVRLSDALKSQITLPNLELMKGLGAMSDREFKTMADSASALDRSMTEGAYRLELQRLEDTLTAMAGTAGTVTPPPGKNPFRK